MIIGKKHRTKAYKVCFVIKNDENDRLWVFSDEVEASSTATIISERTGINHEVVMTYFDKPIEDFNNVVATVNKQQSAKENLHVS